MCRATLFCLSSITVLACGRSDRSPAGDRTGAESATVGSAALTGAGATFPAPIYTKWFDVYARETGVRINYQSIGSGGGIRQFTEGTVDFGATDAPMTDQQVAAVKGNVQHVPTVLGAVVATYNLPSLGKAPLRFDGATLADIFLGRISRWNDRRLAALNPAVSLPDKDIIVVHRSDGSGTTYIFTDYLCKISAEWKTKVGKATSVDWPAGLGGKGNEGVTQQVKQTEGAIGYVELIYAISNGLPGGPHQERRGCLRRAHLGERVRRSEWKRRWAPIRTFAFPSPTPRAGLPTLSPRLPGYWCIGRVPIAPRPRRSTVFSSGCCSPRRSTWLRLYTTLPSLPPSSSSSNGDSAAERHGSRDQSVTRP